MLCNVMLRYDVYPMCERVSKKNPKKNKASCHEHRLVSFTFFVVFIVITIRFIYMFIYMLYSTTNNNSTLRHAHSMYILGWYAQRQNPWGSRAASARPLLWPSSRRFGSRHRPFPLHGVFHSLGRRFAPPSRLSRFFVLAPKVFDVNGVVFRQRRVVFLQHVSFPSHVHQNGQRHVAALNECIVTMFGF